MLHISDFVLYLKQSLVSNYSFLTTPNFSGKQQIQIQEEDNETHSAVKLIKLDQRISHNFFKIMFDIVIKELGT